MTTDISEVEDLDDLLLLTWQYFTSSQACYHAETMRLDATDLRYVTPDEFRVLQGVRPNGVPLYPPLTPGRNGFAQPRDSPDPSDRRAFWHQIRGSHKMSLFAVKEASGGQSRWRKVSVTVLSAS